MARRTPTPSTRPARRAPRDATADTSASAAELERYPRPSVAVDVVALTVAGGALEVALYERATAPSQRVAPWALPGGFMHLDESLEDTAARVLRDKVGLAGVFLEQLFTFGDVHRDPRGRVLTVAYYALVDAARFTVERAESPRATCRARLDVPWAGETGGPVFAHDPNGRPLELFLDHADILGLAVKRLRGKLDYTPVGFQLLPAEFTLRELQVVHEVVRGEAVNKDSFRRRMLASGLLEATGAHERDVGYRPAELYRFSRRSAT